MALAFLSTTSFETPCTITVEQSSEHFHAHVELSEDIAIEPGDKVRVHGAPIQIPFGTRQVFERRATVTRASPLKRGLTKIAAYFDLSELYEVSFNAGRIK
ncbi:hypothetical protein [Porphyrobacter sp. LM 6]|jgi:hypothetical protein|uniref:hypothetical protein n=1 Tax=Porphyrobacter sp. LM 6 TaxID=1896196 RepID=UPI00084666B8|nr:hypothetical protein [Porphyrobacter sp. LM 6]AOL95603.1 hypothetical protein BG023_112694 [Porphyrobacter sp. LM 6]